jgi:hypothetical protein
LADVEQGLIGKEFRHVRLDFWRHINLLIVSRLDVEGESGPTCLSWTMRWRTALGSAWKRRVWKIGTSSGLTVVECCEPLLNWEEPVIEEEVAVLYLNTTSRMLDKDGSCMTLLTNDSLSTVRLARWFVRAFYCTKSGGTRGGGDKAGSSDTTW